MPGYNSQIKSNDSRMIGNIPILPLKGTAKNVGRGIAPLPVSNDEDDIVDESLDLFKANILFSTFEIQQPADLILVYCTLYAILCLKRLQKSPNKERGTQDLFTLALEKFALPGDSDFPLNAFFEKPKTSSDAEDLKKYFTQIRHEVGCRLVEKVFDSKLSNDGKPSKWWICFARKRFLKAELSR